MVAQPSLSQQIIGSCKQQGCVPPIRCRSAHLLTVQELVARGHGVSLVPAMARHIDRDRRCEHRRLTDPRPTRTLRLIWHKARYQSPLVKESIDVMKRQAPR